MKLNKKTLKNGLRILTVPMKDSPAVTMLIMVEAGSKYETKDINGLSHFLEHMCFKGTKKRPTASDISRELDSMGAQYNAFTSQEYTGYWVKVHPKHLAKILDLLSDMYLNPVFDPKEIEKEKGVIVEEINMYEDMPQRHIHDLFMDLLYGDQPAGWNIAGTRELVKSMTQKHFVDYRAKHYVAKGTIVAVAGNFNEKKLIKDIEKSFSEISTAKKHSKNKVVESQSEPKIFIKDKKTDQTHLILGVRTFDIFHKDNAKLHVLNGVLGAGMSSRLFQKLRDEMGVGYYVRSGSDEYTDHGYLAVSTGVDKSRVIEVVKAILNELKRLATEDIPAHELAKAKELLVGNMYLDLETSDSLAQFYGFQEVLKGSEETPAALAKKIEKVTAREVKELAKKIFQDKSLNMAVIGEISDKNALKQALHL